ncbi:MAG: gamma-glutamyl-gamma-aminobutyrate hydrolase family protein [Lachnospiraceae bacterium]|nr:gamma-glutamyl-gamma-aminobutyrate hydrolase family protein [Lachnospiraceae bacterium]
MKIAIIGRKKDTLRYEKYLSAIPSQAFTTLSLGDIISCDGVLLPGGGDITPAFFGEHNKGSRNIDTELDIIQLQATDYCIRYKLPLLGICKGMQVINVAFGGTIIQDLPTAHLHKYMERDQYHTTDIAPDSFLSKLYGSKMTVNSAHHQGIGKIGKQLRPIQWCPEDQCIEAIVHEKLPIIGLQWHPERLSSDLSETDGTPFLCYLASFIEAFS